MILKSIYLTIDDSPSIHTNKKIDFLTKHHIPAIFYARGEHIKKHPQQLINVIKSGFVVGNHSYSHPFFSHISLQQCYDEIMKTEELIEQCYQDAQMIRPHKIIRFPFGDRGAGACFTPPSTPDQKEKVDALQVFLHDQGFTPTPLQHKHPFIDAQWDWDTYDYKRKHIDHPKQYLKLLDHQYQQQVSLQTVLLLHDFDHNHHLFEDTMTYLLNQNITFIAPYLRSS